MLDSEERAISFEFGVSEGDRRRVVVSFDDVYVILFLGFTPSKRVNHELGSVVELEVVVENVSFFEWKDEDWEVVEDFTKGSLGASPAIKIQFETKECFDSFWESLQHLNRKQEADITQFYKIGKEIGQ